MIPQHEPGAKLDLDKPDMSLLTQFPRALAEVSRVGTYGMKKYSRGGWLKVPNGIVRYCAAMLRHVFKESIEGVYDREVLADDFEDAEDYVGKIRHDAQVAWNALAVCELKLQEEEQRQFTKSTPRTLL